MTQEAQMNGQMVLLRAVDGTWEGWRWMPLQEFLQRIDLVELKPWQHLVAVLLPATRQPTLN
jgi:hypothetical protein